MLTIRGYALLLLLSTCTVSIQAQLKQPQVPRDYRRIIHTLNTLKINLDFDGAALADVMHFIQNISGINIVIDPAVYRERAPQDLKVTFHVKQIKLGTALKILLNFQGLAWILQDGVMIITTKRKSHGFPYRKVYDVRALLFRIRDFPGPGITLPTGQEDSAGAQWRAAEKPATPLNNGAMFLEFIKKHTGRHSWETPGVSASLHKGLLVVVQTANVHREIARLIKMLQAAK